MIPKMVIGLGNDEKKYDLTPHNIGYRVLEMFARAESLSWREEKGEIYSITWGTTRLVRPQGYMNTSGGPVAWAARYWKISPEELIVVVDDFELPWGRLRLRASGSAGGHNGLKSIIQSLGTEKFPRLRVGVGPVPTGMDPADFVLKRQSLASLDELAKTALTALRCVLSEGLNVAMNRFNSVSPQ